MFRVFLRDNDMLLENWENVGLSWSYVRGGGGNRIKVVRILFQLTLKDDPPPPHFIRKHTNGHNYHLPIVCITKCLALLHFNFYPVFTHNISNKFWENQA